MLNVYILVSDTRKECTIEGSLELFGQLLATLQRVAPDAERQPLHSRNAAGAPANAAPVTKAGGERGVP